MLIGATIPGGGAGRANVPDDLRVASGPVSTRATAWSLIGLLAVAAAWGSSFPLTKALLERMTPLNFLAVRFTLAALILALIFAKSLHKLSRRTWTHGVLLGIAFASGQILQTIGLQYTPASVSGFITGTYVVLTPMWAALLLHSRIGRRVWIGSGIATVGLAILGLNGFSIGVGEAITLASAAVYALHIVGLGAWTTARDAVGLSVVQLGVTALLSVFFAFLVEGGVALPTTAVDWVTIVFLAVVAGAVAMVVQTWAQAHLAPSRAAIIMATEPAWAALFSVTWLGEPVTWRIAVGGVLMLSAMIIVETGPRRPTEAPHPDEVPKLAG